MLHHLLLPGDRTAEMTGKPVVPVVATSTTAPVVPVVVTMTTIPVVPVTAPAVRPTVPTALRTTAPPTVPTALRTTGRPALTRGTTATLAKAHTNQQLAVQAHNLLEVLVHEEVCAQRKVRIPLVVEKCYNTSTAVSPVSMEVNVS